MKMILVSNRLPLSTEKSAGGLVAGLAEIHQSTDCLWVGYNGMPSTTADYINFKQQLAKQRFISVDLHEKEYHAYYNGISNNVIWPLFHYFPDFMHINADDWQDYEAVNAKFADTILAIAKPNDQIWVHDYQLMRLPFLLRQANPNLSIAYFHHIPFPSSELIRILPFRQELLQGLLGADIIGFHTRDYADHFLGSVNRLLGCDSHLDEIFHENRHVKVVAHPLGVDVRMIQQESEIFTERKEVTQLAHEIGNRAILLGIDRLDYTKGILERLMAFRQLLKQYPQYIGRVILIQISAPSRANIKSYVELRATVEHLVGQINGEFGAPGYTPIQYLYRSFPKEEIIAFYKLASIALVTPLRDGLNLVCKEFVAARDDDDGVLILSETAGAAAEMSEALLVNPYDINNIANAIHEGLTMSAAERHQRMTQLRKRIIAFDNIAWLQTFTKSWQETIKRNRGNSK